MGKAKVIRRRYCDEAMARSKGLIGSKVTSLRRCDHKCTDCPACIEIDNIGNREHAERSRDAELLFNVN